MKQPRARRGPSCRRSAHEAPGRARGSRSRDAAGTERGRGHTARHTGRRPDRQHSGGAPSPHGRHYQQHWKLTRTPVKGWGASRQQRSPREGLAREGREGLVFRVHCGLSAKPSEDAEQKHKSRHHLCCHCLKIISEPFLHPFPAHVMTLFTQKWFIAFMIE